MHTDFWLIQVLYGRSDPLLRGPYTNDTQRLDEYDMCLIDPDTKAVYFIDPPIGSSPIPHIWTPSVDYKNERLQYIANL